MDIKVFGVRVGDMYGPEYEEYLRTKIPNITFINDETDIFKAQWNKIRFFDMDLDEPICVIDIDILLLNDYRELFLLPIEKGEFLTIKAWWDGDSRNVINGGFYKFYPRQFKFIYDEFIKDPKKWTRYFIENKTKPGPYGGEENFVYMMLEKYNSNISFVPTTWVGPYQEQYMNEYNIKYPQPYYFLGGKFNPNVKLVHWLAARPHSHPAICGYQETD